jgi:ATP-dependent exoDNAse (exonuclease V) beta subunit
VAALRAVLGPALEARGRRPLRDWVEGAWLALGGPVTPPDDGAADDVEVFFGLLQELEAEAETGGAALTPERLREAAGALFSLPDPQAGEGLQLMTIHKAKGLEFDTVILPGLGKTPRGDSKKLLYWLETTDADGAPELFFGPVKSARADAGHRTSDWIRAFEAERGRLESGRLLYVATTRAKKKLHLLGHAKPRKDGSLGCDQGSLLARLWPVLGGEWEAAQQVLAGGGTHAAALGPAVESAPPFDPAAARPFDLAPAAPRWRLPAGWSCPQPPPAVGMVQGAAAEDFEAVIYEWAGDTARAVGTVVHRWLQRLGQAPELAAQGGTAALAAFEPAARRMLLQEGVPAAELEPALRRVRAALDRSLQEERGRWILSAEHAEAACEVPLTALIEGQVRRLVVDRTFVDAEGTRWIIDYKTGTHEGGDIAGFLDREQERYRAQLVAYATAFRALEDRPLRTALYFPLVVGGWREVAT